MDFPSINNSTTNAAVIVAHPDDETIWAGGTILLHPEWNWTVLVLCRKSDANRAPKFADVTNHLGVTGIIGDLDDAPQQLPLPEAVVQEMIFSLLPRQHYHVVLTHSPFGEYTRHRRHEETSRAVTELWREGKLDVQQIWMFAYEDGGMQYLPQPIKTAHLTNELPDYIRLEKLKIITTMYGFALESFEAKVIPRIEAFWCFHSLNEYELWLINHRKGASNENTNPL